MSLIGVYRYTIMLTIQGEGFDAYCLNENCTHKTFSERFGFVAPNGM